MRIFELRNGYKVHANDVATGIEFVTYSPDGDAISTVAMETEEAAETLRTLAVAVALGVA